MKQQGMPTTKDQLQRLTSQRWVMVALALLFGVALWQLLWMLLRLPAFILPSPAMVWQKFLITFSNGLLWRH